MPQEDPLPVLRGRRMAELHADGRQAGFVARR